MAQKMTVTSGLKCSALLKKSSPLGLLAKTLLVSPRWSSKAATLAWKAEPVSVTKTVLIMRRFQYDRTSCCSTTSVKTSVKSVTRSSRLLFRLSPSTQRIEETDCGLLPTPTAAAARQGQNDPDGKRGQTLVGAARGQLWPTPMANDAEKRGNIDVTNPRNGLPAAVKIWPTARASGAMNDSVEVSQKRIAKAGYEAKLEQAVALWPTPNASDADKWNNQSLAERKAKGQQIRLNTAVSPEGGQGGALNPTWVEWLMGFPIWWTALEDLETQLCQVSPKKSDTQF